MEAMGDMPGVEGEAADAAATPPAEEPPPKKKKKSMFDTLKDVAKSIPGT
jgi:hypothetical protein